MLAVWLISAISAPSLLASAEVVSVRCGSGVLLRASDPAPKQGAVRIVEVRSDAPLAAVEGRFGSQTLYFWHDDESRVFQALLGVDLYTRPSAASVSVRAVPIAPADSAVDCRLDLRVVDGAFPVQKLRVAPEFVELSSADAARSRREQNELNRIFETASTERLWRGGFESPVPGHGASGSFGKRRVFNDRPRSPHSGEDFSAPAGTPVRAPARGRVVLAKGLFFLGNTVVIDHGFALYTYFGHLSEVDVAPGTLVEPGNIVGKVGATGRVTGAHLDWRMNLFDARIDPQLLVGAMPEKQATQ